MNVSWAANRSWKSLRSCKITVELQLQEHCGKTLTTGVLHWIAIISSEGIDQEGVGRVALSVKECFDSLELHNCDGKWECS